MRIQVLGFASARDLLGKQDLMLEIPEGSRVEEAMQALLEQYPALGAGAGALRFAVNEEFVGATHPLRSGDILALIPPVSGG